MASAVAEVCVPPTGASATKTPRWVWSRLAEGALLGRALQSESARGCSRGGGIKHPIHFGGRRRLHALPRANDRGGRRSSMQSVAEVLAPMNVPVEQAGHEGSLAPMVSTTSVEKPGTLTSSPPERCGAECRLGAALLLHQALCALRVVMQSELSLLAQVGEVLRPELAEVELLFDLLKAVSGQFRHPPVDEHPCDDVEDAVHP